ncbi:MAG: hypothetical protein IPM02_10055 [Betaproteobacteria bacterium]|nr:hypothetical protein [Betaproteobacteria bacterium]
MAWPWRALGLGCVLAIISWMVWTGFDAGRLLGGFYKSEAEERRMQLEGQVANLSEENRQLLSRVTRLESEGQMAKGAQDSLTRQALALQTENTQLKEELSYLQQLVSGNSKEGAITVQRATVERDGPEQVHVRMLVVQGGAKGVPFSGQLSLGLELQQDGRRQHISLPEDQQETAMALKLNFTYYQRIDVTVRVAPGASVRTLQARVFQAGSTQPRVTQTVNLP